MNDQCCQVCGCNEQRLLHIHRLGVWCEDCCEFCSPAALEQEEADFRASKCDLSNISETPLSNPREEKNDGKNKSEEETQVEI